MDTGKETEIIPLHPHRVITPGGGGSLNDCPSCKGKRYRSRCPLCLGFGKVGDAQLLRYQVVKAWL